MNQFPIELHCHTNHSDGQFEVKELIEAAIDFGYKGMILTDHNTTSSAEEVIELGLDKKIVFLKGIEWTTYFGHMLVHDAKRVVDWREATIEDIDEHIRIVKEEDGLVGIAHPFAIGSPICTGCHWEFQIQDWSQVNYIEVWNRTNPHKDFWSELAYQWWIEKLQEGHHIAASAGRDWHGLEENHKVPGITYVLTEDELTPQVMKDALEKGAMYVTLSPRIDLRLVSDKTNETFSIGDCVPRGHFTLDLSILEPDIDTFKRLEVEPQSVHVLQNEVIILEEHNLDKINPVSIHFEKGYLRIEVYGKYGNLENTRLLITSPIYVSE